MKFTGERVVLEDMVHRVRVSQEHLYRYVWCMGLLDRRDSVLDLACGTGYGTALLASASHMVAGIDVDLESIEYAKHMYSRPNIQYHIDDIKHPRGLELNLTFTKVISFETVEHVGEKLYFDYIKRYILKDAEIIISMPFGTNGRKVTSNNEFHVFEPDKKEFNKIADAYFRDYTVYYQKVGDVVTTNEKDARYGIIHGRLK